MSNNTEDGVKVAKCTFGLTEKNIAIIEKETQSFEGALYSRAIWDSIGRQIGWEPLTAALWYFEGKAKSREANLSTQDVQELRDILQKIRSHIRSIIPTHVNADNKSDMSMYHSFHLSEQALTLLSK